MSFVNVQKLNLITEFCQIYGDGTVKKTQIQFRKNKDKVSHSIFWVKENDNTERDEGGGNYLVNFSTLCFIFSYLVVLVI